MGKERHHTTGVVNIQWSTVWDTLPYDIQRNNLTILLDNSGVPILYVKYGLYWTYTNKN